MTEVYQASHIKPKRKRASKAEMAERRRFIYTFCETYHPVTVRQVFYAATVSGHIEKTEDGYNKIQAACLDMRRSLMLPQHWVADNSRSFYKKKTFDGLSNAARSFAQTYARDFWDEETVAVEVWLEKEALVGTVRPVTTEYRVRLVPTRGFASETILYSAVEAAADDGKDELHIVTMYDFDASGQAAYKAVIGRMNEVSEQFGITITHTHLALNYQQVVEMDLPTRPPKKNAGRDKNWPWPVAVELDAIPPEILRNMLRDELEKFMPYEQREYMRELENRDRSVIRMALMDM
jgi:hypothetical protein